MGDTVLLKQTGIQTKEFDASMFRDQWKAWIADRADTTQNGYNVCVRCFLEWLQHEQISNPERSDIILYRSWLLAPHKSRKTGNEITFSADTAARYFRGCKMFFSFLEANGLYTDITRNVRSPKTKANEFKRDALEREDILQVLNSIDRGTEIGKRNYCMILAIVSCGFRIVELQRADIGDIELHAGKHRLYIRGKGHLEKDDYKKLEPELMDAINDYLSTRGTKDPNAPLFASATSNAKKGGGRLTEPSISRIVKGVLKHAGYDSRRLTAHSLRHTSVTLDRKAGATIEEASKHARHSSITITQRYDHALEKAEAKDERRILDFLFYGEEKVTPENKAAEIMARIPADRREEALSMLEALTDNNRNEVKRTDKPVEYITVEVEKTDKPVEYITVEVELVDYRAIEKRVGWEDKNKCNAFDVDGINKRVRSFLAGANDKVEPNLNIEKGEKTGED